MRVRLAEGKIMAGPNGSAMGGDIIEVGDEEGSYLLNSNQAQRIEEEVVEFEVAVESQSDIETAVIPQRKRGRPRK